MPFGTSSTDIKPGDRVRHKGYDYSVLTQSSDGSYEISDGFLGIKVPNSDELTKIEPKSTVSTEKGADYSCTTDDYELHVSLTSGNDVEAALRHALDGLLTTDGTDPVRSETPFDPINYTHPVIGEIDDRLIALQKRVAELEATAKKKLFTQAEVNEIVSERLARQKVALSGLDVSRLVAMEKAKAISPGSILGTPSAAELISIATFLLDASSGKKAGK